MDAVTSHPAPSAGKEPATPESSVRSPAQPELELDDSTPPQPVPEAEVDAGEYALQAPTVEDQRRQLVLSKVLARQGVFYFRLGRYDTAREILIESLSVFRDVGALEETSFCLNNLGQVAQVLGAYEEAKQFLEEGLEASRDTGDPSRIALSLHNLGIVTFHSSGEYAEAKVLYEESLSIRRKVGDLAGMAFTPNPPKDTDGRREDSGRGWMRELQGRWPGVLG